MLEFYFWPFTMSEGLGDCKALTNLNVINCTKLEKLPESKKTVILLSFSCFAGTIIPHRLLFRFWHIAMPEGIGNLIHLETLNCFYCESLVSIPESKIVYFLTLDLVFSLNHLWTILTYAYFCRNLRRLRALEAQGPPFGWPLPPSQERWDLRHPRQDPHFDQAQLSRQRHGVALGRYVQYICYSVSDALQCPKALRSWQVWRQ